MILEITEAIEYTDWKWWKNRETDWPAIQVELVDIIHFFLAAVIRDNEKFDKKVSFEDIALSLCNDLIMAEESSFERDEIGTFPEEGLKLISGLIDEERFYFGHYLAMCAYAELDFDLLYNLCVSKNVLNLFRQNHGYKEGHYLKNWGGREDNVHMYEILSSNEDMTFDEMYQALVLRYTLCIQ
jgi:hypothetical protein